MHSCTGKFTGTASCAYPDRTGDVRSVTTVSDFYSARQWHSTAMYSEDVPAPTEWSTNCCCAARRAPADHPACPVVPRARARLLRTRPGTAGPTAPPPAPGLPRRRTPPPPRPPAHLPALGTAAPSRRLPHQRPNRPAARRDRENRPASTWRTSTPGSKYPAAPPPSPAPSPTGQPKPQQPTARPPANPFRAQNAQIRLALITSTGTHHIATQNGHYLKSSSISPV